MKRIYYIIFAVLSLALVSCLEEERTSFANRGSCYDTKFQMRSVVNSCYIPLKEMVGYSFGMGMEAASDLWYDNSSVADAICDLTPTKNGQANSIWKKCYQGVMYCNEAIECMKNSDKVDFVDKAGMIAECHTLRALYYYYLTCTFNGVPYYTYMVEDMNTLEKIRKLPRTDANVIRDSIYLDLKENALPYFNKANGYWARTCEIDGNRAGAPLALMMMAKMMMWNEKWDEALVALEQLEILYGAFTEANYPLNDTRWSVKNSAESIFEIQHAWSSDGIQDGGGFCRLMYPTMSEGTLDGISMPYWCTQMTTHSVIKCNDYFAHWRPAEGIVKKDDGKKSLFDPLPLTYGEYNLEWNRYNAVLDFDAIKTGVIRGQKIDKRALLVLGLGDTEDHGVYATDDPTPEEMTFNQVRKNGRPYGGTKFWSPNMIGSNDNNNYKIFRYADAILMISECWLNKNDLEKSLAYLNLTRQRAGVDAFTSTSEEEVMGLIRDERARELGGELHRRYDLVRWGIWYESIIAHSNGKIKQFVKECHRYYPIPAKECALSQGALSNPEYMDIADSGSSTNTEE